MINHNQSSTSKSASRPRIGMVFAALLAALSMGLVACSSGNDAGQVVNPNDLQASTVQVSGSDKDLKATFPVPSKAENLSTYDMKTGDGQAAAEGSVVQTKYWLFSGTSGQLVDTSTTHDPEGIDFTLQKGMLVDGFIQGMIGIKPGGERVIVIPPSLGYGETSPGPGIAKNDTLVFVVQAVKVS